MTSSTSGEAAEESSSAATTPVSAHTDELVFVKGSGAMLTQIKTHATKYLPPPVVNAMSAFDSHPVIADNLAPLTSDEPSTAILLSLFAGVAILKLFRCLGQSNFFGGRSTLHVDDDEEYDVLKSKSSIPGDGTSGSTVSFGETVALVGPCGAGKTRLFNTLCCSQGNPQQGGAVVVGTITSMKASAGYLSATDRANGNGNDNVHGKENEAVRLIDYPGHPALRPKLASVVSASSRIVLTLDSTRPVAEGAALLHSILTDGDVASEWRQTLAGNNAIDGKIPILILCTKSDVSKSKNWRRMKIQMRTELERLEKIGGVTAAAGAGADAGSADENTQSGGLSSISGTRLSLAATRGGGLDLDNLGEDIAATLSFMSVGADEGMEALEEFIKKGILPSGGKQ